MFIQFYACDQLESEGVAGIIMLTLIKPVLSCDKELISVQDNRPINLNLLTIRFPITAIISILHRISGIIIFLIIPFWFYALEQSTLSQDAFTSIQSCLQSNIGKAFILLSLTAVAYHFFAGVRHIIMDFGFAEELKSAKLGAKLVVLLTIGFAIMTGAWLW